jgi:hypothetical protein
MRIDGHQPVEGGRDQLGEAARADRFAAAKARVLTHVRQVGRDEPAAGRSQFAQRVGEEEQAGQLRIGIAQLGDDDDVAAGDRVDDAQVALAVGKAPALEAARRGTELAGDAFGGGFGAWQGDDLKAHDGDDGSIAMMSGCVRT